MITRAEIAAALSTVPGVTGHPQRPATPSAGQAWPVWRRTVPLNMRADGPRSITWYVAVCIGNAGADASASEADALIEPVSAALLAIVAASDGSTLRIDAVEPATDVLTDTGAAIPLLRWQVTN